ncbi:hypothetical protein QJS10_CPB18g01119 [Acorus calamus]|uniref:Uncharacterized protein n=1 Tax=Acorus calamus TaxID=4465 RepID=A0AAV9CNA4_ACOCL|nr:hypothetical protein QJS10_CPB18g01119 [Acorus calamus]
MNEAGESAITATVGVLLSDTQLVLHQEEAHELRQQVKEAKDPTLPVPQGSDEQDMTLNQFPKEDLIVDLSDNPSLDTNNSSLDGHRLVSNPSQAKGEGTCHHKPPNSKAVINKSDISSTSTPNTRSSEKHMELKEFLKIHKPHLVSLIDTNLDESSLLVLQRKLGFYPSSYLSPEARICLLWHPDLLTIQVLEASRQFVHCSVFRKKSLKTTLITAVYASNSSSERLSLWESIKHLSTNSANQGWIVGGDFNEVRFSYEKVGGLPIHSRRLRKFNSSILHAGLDDLKSFGHTFSWCNRQSVPIMCRLDRVLANQAFISKYPHSLVEYLPPGISDHSPLKVIFEPPIPSGPKPFKYFEAWEGSQEEKFARQKSRQLWLEAGDSNTKFFYNSIKDRSIRNSICRLRNPDDSYCSDPEEIKKRIVQFYHDLLNRDSFTDIFLPPPVGTVSAANNVALCAPVSEDELYEAIIHMKALSSPGPDGFPAKFYQLFWPLIKDDLLLAINFFFQKGKLLRQILKILLAEEEIQKNVENAYGLTPLDMIQQSQAGPNDAEIIRSLSHAGCKSGGGHTQDMMIITTTTPAAVVAHQARATRGSRMKKLVPCDWNEWCKKDNEWLKEAQREHMVVATLISAAAFQGGINVPSNSQDDDNIFLFLRMDMVALMVSTSVIVFLVSGLPLKHRITTWLLTAALWLAVTFLVYAFVVRADINAKYDEEVDTWAYNAYYAWLGLMACLFLYHLLVLVVVFLLWLRRKVKDSIGRLVEVVRGAWEWLRHWMVGGGVRVGL